MSTVASVNLDFTVENITLLFGTLFVTIFSIIGNAIPAFVFKTTSASAVEVRMYLWRAKICVIGTETCTAIGRADLDSVLDGFCSGAASQLRAAEAGGIISCLLSGAVFIFAVTQLVRTMRLQSFILIGACFAMTLVQLITFLVFVTLKSQNCVSSQVAAFDYRAAPFMYLAGLIISLIQFAIMMLCSGSSQSESNPRSNSHLQEHDPISQSAVFHTNVEPQQPRADLARQIQLPAVARFESTGISPAIAEANSHSSTTVVQSTPQTEQQSANLSVNNVFDGPEPESVQRFEPRLASGSTLEHPIPDGDDWAIDEGSELLWSNAQALFFDPASAEFYDPASELWFNPTTREWHRIEAESS